MNAESITQAASPASTTPIRLDAPRPGTPQPGTPQPGAPQPGAPQPSDTSSASSVSDIEHQIEVEVQVLVTAPNTAEFLYDGRPQLVVVVPAGDTLRLRLTLTPESGAYVTYPTNWFSDAPKDGGQPVPQPEEVDVSTEGPQALTILDQNLNPGAFYFTLSVLLGGTVYVSPDPTIINRPDG